MFGDWGFICNRLDEQTSNYEKFKSNLAKTGSKLLIIELGAGTAVPTVRRESEVAFVNPKWSADFIRINPLAEHSKIDSTYKNRAKGQSVQIPLDALTALTLIDEAIKKKLKQ